MIPSPSRLRRSPGSPSWPRTPGRRWRRIGRRSACAGAPGAGSGGKKPQEMRRDPERGLQSWFRPAKPETRNPKPTVKVGFELRNPKPETDSEDLTSPGPIETKPETRNRQRKLP